MRSRLSRILAIALVAGAALFAVPVQHSVAARGATPPPLPSVQSVTDLGNVTENPVIYARDGIQSGVINGTAIWTFGDTPLSVPGHDRDGWSDNTLSWTTDLNASDGINLDHDVVDQTGAPTEYIPFTQEERSFNRAHQGDHCRTKPCNAEFAIWSGPVWPDPTRNRVLLPYIEIYRIIGSSSWTYVGTGVAVWATGGTVVRPVLSAGTSTPTLMWKADDVAYNSGALFQGDTMYAYGCQAGFLVQHCRVARVSLADALDLSKWQYYTAAGTWSFTPADAVVIFDGGAAGNTVFYSAYLGEYVAVYSAIYSDKLMYRVSSTPWGPWSGEALLFTARPGWNGSTSYAGGAHPEYAQGNGQTQYVTYFHTTGFLRGDIPLVKVVFGPPA
jgi:hypothetical protein